MANDETPAGRAERDALRAAFLQSAPDAGERLRAALARRRADSGEHAAWARLCDDVGETALALSEYQLALRDDPDDPSVLSRITALYEERGDLDHAIECAQRWTNVAPGDARAATVLVDLLVASDRLERAREAVDEIVARGLGGEHERALRARLSAGPSERDDDDAAETDIGTPTDADVVRFAHMFAGRENVHARQWTGPGGEGGYSPVREPLTVQVARNHLLGTITVGAYPLRLDNTVTFFAFDVDITRRALSRARGSVGEARRLKALVASEAIRLLEALSEMGVDALLEDSGFKGRHLWVFLEQAEDAAVVRSFGTLFLRVHAPSSPDLHVEFFPKQAAAEGGVGNLIKLPLGIHRRTGRRSRILRSDGGPEPDPFGALRRHPRLSRAALLMAIARLKSVAIAAGATAPTGQDEPAPETRDLGAFPAPPPSWTSADFDAHPEVSHLLSCCAVLAALRTKAERHRRLTHDEQVVLKHALGHSGPGVLAVNYLLDACADVAPTARLQSPLAGNPISCPKIRRRIPHVTGAVDCNCAFDFAPNQYPNPRLHLMRARPAAPGPGATEPASWDPIERVRVLRMLRVRREEVEADLAKVEAELVAYMERSASSEIRLDDGVLRLVRQEGAVPALSWEPASGGAPAPPADTDAGSG